MDMAKNGLLRRLGNSSCVLEDEISPWETLRSSDRMGSSPLVKILLGVGVSLGVIIGALLTFLFWRRRRRRLN